MLGARVRLCAGSSAWLARGKPWDGYTEWQPPGGHIKWRKGRAKPCNLGQVSRVRPTLAAPAASLTETRPFSICSIASRYRTESQSTMPRQMRHDGSAARESGASLLLS